MKEKELVLVVEEILEIIDNGGIVTIDLEKGSYVPAPIVNMKDCRIKLKKYDSTIRSEELLKELQEKNEFSICQIRPGIVIIAKRGTSIVAYH